MIKCCFCESEYEQTKDICEGCLEWLYAGCIPGADENITGHDRGSALGLVDALQRGEPITDKAFDLIRRCISRGAEFGQCNCIGCRPHDCKTTSTEEPG